MAGRLSGHALSQVCQRILDAELPGALVEGRDFRINLQRGKRPNNPDVDAAPEALVTSISQDVFNRPTYGLFFRLLNNYTRATGVAETITPEKEREISNFLDAVLASAPMRVAHEYLASQNLVAQQLPQFKDQLYQMWFRLYTRETRDDSCGFEHVFVGESDQGKISGLHNWLQLHNLEKSGELDYRGYIFPRRRGGGGGGDNTVTPSDLIISVQFNVGGETKDVSSIWLGTSPEFEMALYTLCFVAAPERSTIELTAPSGTYEVEIRAYHIKSKYGDKVGSAFPNLLSKQPGSGQAPAPHQQQHQQPQQPQQPAWQQGPLPNGYPVQQPPQAPPQQQDSANQGCAGFVVELLKMIFSKK